MQLFAKSNSKASSRRQIAIKGVEDGVLMLPGNKYRAVLQVSSINFELKSEEEQDALIETYQNFLNSLACPVQILLRVREMDTDRYLEGYRERRNQEKEAIYKKQIEGYTKFVKSLIKSNKILSRQFYIVVPYSAERKVEFETVKEQLALDIGIIDRGLAKLGMQTRQLNSLEVLDLFYSFYGAERAKNQPLTDQTMEVLSKQYV